jgi:hypothetical protein
MDTIFDADVYAVILRRIESVQPDSPRQWGKMTPAQMLEHTARAVDMATGRTRSKQILLGKVIGWMVKGSFVGSKPFGKNGPTGPEFIVKDEPDFARAKERLKAAITELHAMGQRGCDGNVHAFFGRMTGEEWGITQYKHLDHHLRQFGA